MILAIILSLSLACVRMFSLGFAFRFPQVRWLLSVGCATDVRDKSGATALVHAVLGSQCACGAMLVEAGAHLDAVDLSGKPALLHAVSLPQSPASSFFVELLLASGASLDVKDAARGWTALHWAMSKRHFGHLKVRARASREWGAAPHALLGNAAHICLGP